MPSEDYKQADPVGYYLSWVVMFLLGPLLFGGEVVGPMGNTPGWRWWVCALGGSLLWVAIIAGWLGYV